MRKFQGRVAVSKWALPFAAVYGVLAWLGAGLVSLQLWVPFVLMFLTTYVMAELNTRNALLRIRSRMVSFSFIMMVAMNVTMMADWRVSLVQLCLAVFLFVIFTTYQNSMAMGEIFLAFLCVGVASVAWVHVLYLVPLFLIFTIRPLYSFSIRTLSASILGLLLPYWLLFAYLIYIGDFQPVVDHFMSLADFSQVLKYNGITIGMAIVCSVLFILFLTGAIHFVRRSYNDKIRVRECFRILMITALVLVAMLCVVPCHAPYLIAMLEVLIAPLIAHFIVFTRTKVTNWAFIVGIMVVIMLMLFELCLTSLYNMVL